MEVTMADSNDILKPFFLPIGLDIDTLPPQLGAALLEIVTPFYQRYVLRGSTPLEVSAGVSATFLLAEEIIAQFEIGQQFFCGHQCPQESTQRQTKIDALFRLLGAKMRFMNLLHRLAEFYQ